MDEMNPDRVSASAIRDRIERHRKANGSVVVRGVDGRPVPGVKVRVRQVRHGFLFGCNAFPLLGHTDPDRETVFQERLTRLMNYATLAFYWGQYEREQGVKLESERMAQARWLKAQGIATKGHPLVWHEVYPAWAPRDAQETASLLESRVKEIVSRFAGTIDIWDVVNEATVATRFESGVTEWVRRDGAPKVVQTALGWAREANPRATLLANDYNTGPELEQFLDDLATLGGDYDVLGLQSHMHAGEISVEDVWERCETYARFGKPIHFTELSVISGEHGWLRPAPWPTTADGERRQAEYVARLYELLFSHPSVQAITWWDLMDGAWMGAPSGLIRADYSPKPAYDALDELVNHRWRTELEVQTGSDGSAPFRGFVGDYAMEAALGGGTLAMEATLDRDEAQNVFTLSP